MSVLWRHRIAVRLPFDYRWIGVVPLAHTPLGKGLATGVYTASNPTGGKMGPPKYVFKDLFPLTPIHTALAAVSVVVF